jgi:hypothetical protein
VLAVLFGGALLAYRAFDWATARYGPPRPPRKGNLIMLAEAPCVAGVCVGTHGQDVVVERLSRHESIRHIKAEEHFVAFWVTDGSSGRFWSVNGSVTLVRVHLNEIRLGDVLEALGEPDDLYLSYICGGRNPFIRALLIYRDRGIEVELLYAPTRQEQRNRGRGMVLTTDTPVHGSRYFDASRYRELLQARRDRAGRVDGFPLRTEWSSSDIIIADGVRPWPGTDVPVDALVLWCNDQSGAR